MQDVKNDCPILMCDARKLHRIWCRFPICNIRDMKFPKKKILHFDICYANEATVMSIHSSKMQEGLSLPKLITISQVVELL